MHLHYIRSSSHTHLQFSHYPLDEVVAQLDALQAGLGGGDGVEDGRVYLVHVLLGIESGELTDDTLRKKQRQLLQIRVGSGGESWSPDTSLSPIFQRCTLSQTEILSNFTGVKPPFSPQYIAITGSEHCRGCFKGLGFVLHTAVMHLSAEVRRRNKAANPRCLTPKVRQTITPACSLQQEPLT